MITVIGVVQCELLHRGELAFDTVQPRGIRRSTIEFDVMFLGPVPDLSFHIGTVIVHDDMKGLVRGVPAAKLFQELKELWPAFL